MENAVKHGIPKDELRYDERPWGSWELLAMGPGYKVKRLIVKPGQRLSLQFHHHRSEHWVVVQGTATVIRDDERLVLRPDDSTYIPRRGRHRIMNEGTEPLVIIEVQVGTCDEDDIVRLEDDYGRADA